MTGGQTDCQACFFHHGQCMTQLGERDLPGIAEYLLSLRVAKEVSVMRLQQDHEYEALGMEPGWWSPLSLSCSVFPCHRILWGGMWMGRLQWPLTLLPTQPFTHLCITQAKGQLAR